MIRSGKPKFGGPISRSALGLALALGTVAGGFALSTPALAAKKEAAPKLALSKGFQAVALEAQKAIEAAKSGGDATDAKAKLEAAKAAIENQDDRMMYGSLAINLGQQTKDNALQRSGLKAMIESGKGDPAGLPKFNYFAGALAYEAKDYAEAEQYLKSAIASGFYDNNVEAVLAETYLAQKKDALAVTTLKGAIDRMSASGTPAPESWYRRALGAAYNSGNQAQAASFASDLVEAYPTPKNWGAAIAILRDVGKYSGQETLDLMRLMDRTGSWTESRDFIEFVQSADPRRLPGEVLKVIEAGTAKGLLKASDPFVADAKSQASGRLSADKSSLTSYAADAKKSGATEASVSGAADALLSYGQAAQAAELYQIALGKPGVDTARTLTRLGIAQTDAGDYAAAQATFAKVTGPRKGIAELWSAYAAQKAKGGTTAPVSTAATTQ